jgi:translation initiation factor 4A
MATDKGLEDVPEGQIESNYDETVDSFDDMNLRSELLRGGTSPASQASRVPTSR